MRTERDLSGWGRYPFRTGPVETPRSASQIAALLAGPAVIARGNGRAYGDSAMGAAATIDMRGMNRMLSFDPEAGRLVAEAGVILGDVIRTFLPRGWFPYVTPGTKFVTLGGAVAADVHGKNHHRDGAFGAFVDWIDVMGPDGGTVRAERGTDLFEWTLGGMGLTGVILRVALRLRPVGSGWIRQRTIVAPGLADAMAAMDAHADATYSVAWIDCLASGAALGRSLVMLGEHAGPDEVPEAHRDRPFETPPKRSRRIPTDLPGWILNRHTVRAFNALYWRQGQRSKAEALVDWDSYFYPLDAILEWNRIYGRGGFVQFQCVLPPDAAESGLRALLTETASAGQGSFLAVLKRMGPQESRFSFPMDGFTLALDFPATTRALALVARLEAVAIDHGGRFYLAKDARMSDATLRRADARTGDFARMREERDLSSAFASAQSRRLAL